MSVPLATAQLEVIFQDFISKADVSTLVDFTSTYGLVKWNSSRILSITSNDNYVASLPVVDIGKISAVLFVQVDGSVVKYKFISYNDLNQPISLLLDSYASQDLTLMITEFIYYEQLLGGYTHELLLHHFYEPVIQSEIIEIGPRGWCLVGGQKVLNKLPQSWKDLPGVSWRIMGRD